MCGIAGIFNISGQPVKPSEIDLIVKSLMHRGPDGSGKLCDKNIGLGHCRLAIFDLSEIGNQPMISPDGRYAIVYNGEVYNWPEIRRELKNKIWISNTDTETILHAYIERGEDCLLMFNGMFAFAIFDREKENLFMARDRIGIKPFFYGYNNGRLYFASEIKAFFAGNFPRSPNYSAIYDFLHQGLIDHSCETFFQDILSLKPGHFLIVDKNGNSRSSFYWSLEEIIGKRTKVDLPEIIDQYNTLLEDSIDLCLRGDVPIGVFLSGGVDSSVLASRLAKRSSAKQLEAYTYEFDTGGAGEGEYAKRVSDWLGLEWRVSTLNHKEVPDYFYKVLYHEEMPITSLRVLASHKLYEEVSKGSTVVLLEGHGGDQIGAGFEYYLFAYIKDVIKRIGTIEAFEYLNSMMDMYNIPLQKRFERLFNYLGSDLNIGSATQDGVPFVKNKCLSKELIFTYASRRMDFPRPFSSHLLNSQFIDLNFHNLPRVLRYADRGSMAVGREARVPLLDHRVVELSFCSTENARVRDGQQRYFMRKAANLLLPEEILTMPKRSIVDPQRRWLQNELKDWVSDIFYSDTFGNRGIFDQKEVIREYESFCKEEKPATGFHIFQYLNMELWFRVMIDSPSVEPEKK